MGKLTFENVSLKIDNYAKLENVIAFDLKTDMETLENLYQFMRTHIEDENSFSYKVNDESFFGRFGQFVYDKNGNIRFFLTTDPVEKDKNDWPSQLVSRKEPLFINTVKVLSNLESRFNTLVDLLLSKKIIDPSDLKDMKPYLTIQENSVRLLNEVESLQTYLEENGQTLEEIK